MQTVQASRSSARKLTAADRLFAAGWDVFGLDYRVGEPVASLLGEAPMRGYGRLFHLLWSLQVGPPAHLSAAGKPQALKQDLRRGTGKPRSSLREKSRHVQAARAADANARLHKRCNVLHSCGLYTVCNE